MVETRSAVRNEERRDTDFSAIHSWKLNALLNKRAFDVVAATLLLLFLLPVFALLIAAQLAFDPRAPIFFRQARVGRGERSSLA